MAKTIYNLGLHEKIQIDGDIIVQRVPSGWNYIYTKKVHNNDGDYLTDEISQIVFVPFDNGFQERG